MNLGLTTTSVTGGPFGAETDAVLSTPVGRALYSSAVQAIPQMYRIVTVGSETESELIDRIAKSFARNVAGRWQGPVSPESVSKSQDLVMSINAHCSLCYEKGTPEENFMYTKLYEPSTSGSVPLPNVSQGELSRIVDNAHPSWNASQKDATVKFLWGKIQRGEAVSMPAGELRSGVQGQGGSDWTRTALIVGGVIAAGALAYYLIKKRRSKAGAKAPAAKPISATPIATPAFAGASI